MKYHSIDKEVQTVIGLKLTIKKVSHLSSKLPKTAWFVVLFSSLLFNNANAENLNVVVGGNSDCIAGCDLQFALDRAATNGADDTITMQAGVYTITTLDTPYRFVPTDGARLDLLSANAKDVIITRANPSDENTQSQLFNIKVTAGAASSISVSNITFQDGRNTAGNSGGLYISSIGTDITINNNIFLRNYAELGFGGGLFVETVSGDIELNNNMIKDNFPLPFGDPTNTPPLANILGAGAYLKSDTGNISLVNNIIVGNRNEVVVDPTTNLPILDPDLPDIPDKPKYDTYGGGVYIESTSAGDITLTNNTIMNNLSALGGAGAHILINNDVSKTSIYNNIAWGNVTFWVPPSAEIRVENDGDNNSIGSTVELFNNNYSSAEVAVDGLNVSEENSILRNPILNEAFVPVTGCLCIDSGTIDAPRLPIYDFYGLSRRLGDFEIPDMGAAEYTPSKFSNENCFIATAAYGSFMHDDVKLLRQFRDAYLLSNTPGKWFVDMYYDVSPPIADFIRQHEWLRALTRWLLAPLVMTIKYPVLMAGLVFLGVFGLLFFNRQRRYRKSLSSL